jgi:Ca2+-binding RTX toxin-like protein
MATITGNSIEDGLIGTSSADTMYGYNGDDVLVGRGGNDILKGGGGADMLYGDDGWDTASYTDSNAAVTVNLMRGVGSGGTAEGDTLKSIEQVEGSAYNDWLGGDENRNILNGNGGNDVLKGYGGNDTLNGGVMYMCPFRRVPRGLCYGVYRWKQTSDRIKLSSGTR